MKKRAYIKRGAEKILGRGICAALGIADDSTGNQPHVVICGGGPAGLLASILLDDVGIPTTVLERRGSSSGSAAAASVDDQRQRQKCRDDESSSSYVISLNERGRRALDHAPGCLEAALQAGKERERVYLLDGRTGETKSRPMKSNAIAMTLSSLVECLEGIAAERSNVRIVRGVDVDFVEEVAANGDDGPGVRVRLDDGSVVRASHVIGADGKWSRVRRSFEELRSRASMERCPIFVVRMECPAMPDGWMADGVHAARPSDEGCKFYLRMIPLPGDGGGGLSISMYCFDDAVERYPWLAPPPENDADDDASGGGWGDKECTRADHELPRLIEELLREELPALHDALDEGTYRTARIGHRLSWLRMAAPVGVVEEGGREGKVSYSTSDGRAVLVGDAAHAMTPSIGEGPNAALESAAKLVECITFLAEEGGGGEKAEGGGCISANTLSRAFVAYGSERPAVAQLIQKMSLARNEFLQT